ncbi:unnamed protein product, partial [Pylaiella littoralis]
RTSGTSGLPSALCMALFHPSTHRTARTRPSTYTATTPATRKTPTSRDGRLHLQGTSSYCFRLHADGPWKTASRLVAEAATANEGPSYRRLRLLSSLLAKAAENSLPGLPASRANLLLTTNRKRVPKSSPATSPQKPPVKDSEIPFPKPPAKKGGTAPDNTSSVDRQRAARNKKRAEARKRRYGLENAREQKAFNIKLDAAAKGKPNEGEDKTRKPQPTKGSKGSMWDMIDAAKAGDPQGEGRSQAVWCFASRPSSLPGHIRGSTACRKRPFPMASRESPPHRWSYSRLDLRHAQRKGLLHATQQHIGESYNKVSQLL